MTDAEVLAAIQKARAVHKAAVTRANRAHKRAADHAFAFFGSSDVEQAARSNAIHRAELTRSAAIEAAADKFRAALADIRANAGEWAELVPAEVV